MVLFKDSLSQFTPVKRNGKPNAHSMYLVVVRSKLHAHLTLALSEDFVQNAIKVLIGRFMCLNAADLANWMADPEEWVNVEEKENDQWEYEIRVSKIRVFSRIYPNTQGGLLGMFGTRFGSAV